MQHRRGAFLGAATVASLIAVMVFASPAFAKGPSEAVLTGPGLSSPLQLKWATTSTTTGPDLGIVIRQSGFWVGLLKNVRMPGRLPAAPSGALGPRYTIAYTMTIPGKPTSTIVQYVYPYAEPRPITYMPPGQPFWGTSTSAGSWFAAPVALKQTLIQLGLPATAPPPHPDAGGSTTGFIPAPAASDSLVLPMSILGVLLAGAVVGLVVSRGYRRRGQRA